MSLTVGVLSLRRRFFSRKPTHSPVRREAVPPLRTFRYNSHGVWSVILISVSHRFGIVERTEGGVVVR